MTIPINGLYSMQEQQQQNQTLMPGQLPSKIYIFNKDSKMISIYNTETKEASFKKYELNSGLPHNFQYIQIGLIQPRTFLIGGGAFKSIDESMYQCRELVERRDKNNFDLELEEKSKMKYARHGHSCCSILDRYIIVSGSRKDADQASQRVEIYDTTNNYWVELPMINTERHYHSSCSFNHKFIYIFGGIHDKKYSNSIERLILDINNPKGNEWKLINMSLIENRISPRQGSQICQLSNDEIMIVGGFNGKFSNDSCTIKFDINSGEPIEAQNQLNLCENQPLQIFPYQMPIFGNIQNKEILTIDWVKMSLYKIQNNQFNFLRDLRNSSVSQCNNMNR